MISLTDARKIVLDRVENCRILGEASYGHLYIFRVWFERPFEEQMDPFVSVDRVTGEFSDFSILTDIPPEHAASLVFTSTSERR